MTYCAERTHLLAQAGPQIALKLLPEPFVLWYSDHTTGTQMTIATKGSALTAAIVWKGSIWNSHIYEFNDEGDIPGLQPDFEFARAVIDKYFADVEAAIQARNEELALIKSTIESDERNRKAGIVESVRRQIEGT